MEREVGGMQREGVREGEGEIERDAERGREKYYQIATRLLSRSQRPMGQT
jgi:hypothetical protein